MKDSERIIPLLDLLLRSLPVKERAAVKDDDLLLSRTLVNAFKDAFERVRHPDYVCFYEDDKMLQNLYAEGFFDGMEAGLKAAGVVVELMEDTGK